MAFNVSKTVSTNKKSTCPSTRAATCSLYAVTSSSNVIALNPGSLTSGDIEAVLVVGPILPATNLGLSLVENFLQAALANLADSRLSS